ncbi:MAG: hypothetical protein GX937_00625 [Lentisphaerae bacterium]|jgi:hypothetical protein|nr:hypothetical protein [Lentisphaerota bacterium]
MTAAGDLIWSDVASNPKAASIQVSRARLDFVLASQQVGAGSGQGELFFCGWAIIV